MKTRSDFLRAQKGLRRSAPGLGIETCLTPDARARDGVVRYGITASRKVGGAVERNRAKRRLREVARATLPTVGRPMRDYVLIARTATLTRDFAALMQDFLGALHTVHATIDRGAKDGSRVG